MMQCFLVGDSYSGKTCLFNALQGKNFAVHPTTISIDKNWISDIGYEKLLEILDTPSGQLERMPPFFSTKPVIILFCFSKVDKCSFEYIKNHAEVINTTTTLSKLVLVETFSDETENAEVTTEEARYFAETHEMKFFDVSSKTGAGIQDLKKYLFAKADEIKEALLKRDKIG